jgi:hypothetical protein
MTGDFGDGKFLNKIFFEEGGKRQAGGDDKLTFFFMGPNVLPNLHYCVNINEIDAVFQIALEAIIIHYVIGQLG